MGLEDAVVPAALTGLAGWVLGRRRGSHASGDGDGQRSRPGDVVRQAGRRVSETAGAQLARAGHMTVAASSKGIAAGGAAVASGLASAIDLTAEGADWVRRAGSGVARSTTPLMGAVVGRYPSTSRGSAPAERHAGEVGSGEAGAGEVKPEGAAKPEGAIEVEPEGGPAHGKGT